MRKEDMDQNMAEGNHVGIIHDLPQDYNLDDEDSDFEMTVREDE